MGQIEDDILKVSRKCILAVDDTAIVLTRIADTLRNDYEVVTVNSGARALKYLSQERPDLILLDIQMPTKDGIETLREMRSRGFHDIPVIMLTGMESKSYVLESAKLGICDYILKPFSSEDLLSRIKRVLEPDQDKLGKDLADFEKLCKEDGRR